MSVHKIPAYMLFAFECAMASSQQVHAQISTDLWTPIVYDRQASPGGGIFVNLVQPDLDSSGAALFNAEIAPAPGVGPTVPSIWSRFADGTLSRVAAAGTAAPGLGGAIQYSGFSTSRASSPSHLAFGAGLVGPGVTSLNDEAIFAGSPQAVQLLARTGDSAAGLPGLTYSNSFQTQAVNAAGSTLFRGFLSGPGVNNGNGIAVWAGSPGSVQLAARAGSAVRPSDPTVLYDFNGGANFPYCEINNSGLIAMETLIQGTGVQQGNNFAVVAGTPGAMDFVARAGLSAPGFEGTYNFGRLNMARLNNAGQVSFVGELNRPGMTSPDSTALWLGTPGNIHAVIQKGQPLPGFPGTTLGSLEGGCSINDAGGVALIGGTSSPQRSAVLYRDGTGVLHTIAMQGQPAPGFGPGAVFLNANTYFGEPAVSPEGLVAFIAAASNSVTGQVLGEGLWCTTPSGELTLVARSGQQVTFGPGNVQTIGQLLLRNSAGVSPYMGNVFGPGNELAFTAALSGGGFGEFIVTIPSPSAAVLIPVMFAAVTTSRRRRSLASQ